MDETVSSLNLPTSLLLLPSSAGPFIPVLLPIPLNTLVRCFLITRSLKPQLLTFLIHLCLSASLSRHCGKSPFPVAFMIIQKFLGEIFYTCAPRAEENPLLWETCLFWRGALDLITSPLNP